MMQWFPQKPLDRKACKFQKYLSRVEFLFSRNLELEDFLGLRYAIIPSRTIIARRVYFKVFYEDFFFFSVSRILGFAEIIWFP